LKEENTAAGNDNDKEDVIAIHFNVLTERKIFQDCKYYCLAS